jgi:hypothetical protein
MNAAVLRRSKKRAGISFFESDLRVVELLRSSETL